MFSLRKDILNVRTPISQFDHIELQSFVLAENHCCLGTNAVCWPMHFQRSSWCCFPSPCRLTGLADASYNTQPPVSSEDPNSGPQACTASALIYCAHPQHPAVRLFLQYSAVEGTSLSVIVETPLCRSICICFLVSFRLWFSAFLPDKACTEGFGEHCVFLIMNLPLQKYGSLLTFQVLFFLTIFNKAFIVFIM